MYQHDPEILYRVKNQFVAIIFQQLYENFNQYDLIVSLWENKYKKIYLEHIDKRSVGDSSSYYTAIRQYCYSLNKTRKKNKTVLAVDEMEKMQLAIPKKAMGFLKEEVGAK